MKNRENRNRLGNDREELVAALVAEIEKMDPAQIRVLHQVAVGMGDGSKGEMIRYVVELMCRADRESVRTLLLCAVNILA